MRYEKAETVLRVALDMQASALGLSLEELLALAETEEARQENG